MYLFLLSILYLIGFLVQSSRDLFSKDYDHDVDQFMYFGSRLLHGELIWTSEFDDKAPVLQFLFAIPAFFKSTSLWVLFSIISALIASTLLYLLVCEWLSHPNINISNKKVMKIGIFSSVLYLTLQAYIFGGLVHVNSFCSSINLTSISLLYFSKKNQSQLIRSSLMFSLAAFLAAIAISIRPYLLLPISFSGLWVEFRFLSESSQRLKGITSKIIYTKVFYWIKWLILILLFGTLANLFPYLLTGNLESFLIGLKLNSFEYLHQNIFLRQYINLGRNPILYPVLITFISLPILLLIFRRKNKLFMNYSSGFLSQVDIDIIFFTVICPIFLELSFLKRHFFGHYYNLFTPYACISFAYLIAISIRLEDSISIGKFKSIKDITIIIIMTVCLLTDRSISNSIFDIFNGTGQVKTDRLAFVQKVVQNYTSADEPFFLFPENNYVHWNLSESRHGFPQKIVFRNIKDGKMDKAISEYSGPEYNFLLPKKKELCNSLIEHGPFLIFTYTASFTDKCLLRNYNVYEKLILEDKVGTKLQVFKRLQQ